MVLEVIYSMLMLFQYVNSTPVSLVSKLGGLEWKASFKFGPSAYHVYSGTIDISARLLMALLLA